MASTSCIYIHSYLYLSPSFSKGSSSSSISRLMPISCISKQLKYSRGLTFSQTKLPMWPSSSSSSSSSSCFQVFSLPAPKATVTGKTWDKSVLNSEVPVLVEFYASWCGPCAMVHRVIDEIAAEYSGRINCFTLHADNELKIADEYNIKAVPVVMLFKNGAKCETVVGTMPKEFYVAAIERVLVS